MSDAILQTVISTAGVVVVALVAGYFPLRIASLTLHAVKMDTEATNETTKTVHLLASQSEMIHKAVNSNYTALTDRVEAQAKEIAELKSLIIRIAQAPPSSNETEASK